NRFSKLSWPRLVINVSSGIIMSFTSDVTIFPNAPPIMTPTARSMTFPFTAKSLNSLKNFIMNPPNVFAGRGRPRPVTQQACISRFQVQDGIICKEATRNALNQYPRKFKLPCLYYVPVIQSHRVHVSELSSVYPHSAL